LIFFGLSLIARGWRGQQCGQRRAAAEFALVQLVKDERPGTDGERKPRCLRRPSFVFR
jgi:hypothetical protein